jgi:hypothetical protein
MSVADAPVSYKDPYWSDLASSTEQKLGLPEGLLTSIITKGERSNNDQVSEAGARTVAQITPSTRKLILDKYGVDPYLNPQNAIEGAGLLLKEGLERNKGDASLAVAEYHGGTDRSNWGPRTRAYVGRVTGSDVSGATSAPKAVNDAPAAPATPPAQGSMPDGSLSTFDRLSAAQNKPAAPSLANIFSAYQSGQMTPEESKQFEDDVKAGHIMLPRGAALKPAAAPGDGGGAESERGPAATVAAPAASAAGALPAGVVQAYQSGHMPVADRIQLEKDVKAGLVSLPPGVQLQDTQAPGFLARVKEQVTGAERQTEQTQALPDWATMPELNTFSMASAKTGLGTLLSNPQETVQVIKANFPGVQVGQDDKGNFLLTSSIDGKQYAIKPGFQASDIPRAAGAVAAFTPAGRATSIVGAGIGAAATQAAIEGSQAATGGTFDPKEVLVAGAGGAAVPAVGRVITPAIEAGGAALQRLRGAPQPAAAAREGAVVAPEAGAVPQTAPVVSPTAPGVPAAAPAAPMAAADLVQTAKTAAEGGMGSRSATQTLAEQAAPNAKTVDAAKRLGIEDYLQPDHVTTSQAYRELAQAVKSLPGSEARSAELQGLDKVGQRAEKLIDDIGGTTDVSLLDANVKGALQKTQSELETRANKLYGDLREAIPAKTAAPADSVLAFIKQRADELGGAANLSPMEKQILAKLSPKGGGDMLEALGPAARRQAMEQGADAVRQPTYALLDDVRKDLGAAARQAGPFKDADTGLAKKLYGLLSDDQAAVVNRAGMGATYNAARKAVAVRKGIEDDLVALFGKQVDGSLIGNLTGAVRALPQGDSSKLLKLLSAVPPELRQEVTASGLASAFRTAGTRGPINFGTFEKWYDGLLRNKQAHAAIMTNLPPAARKQISDLYRVAKGISAASRERITTGRIQAVQEQFRTADSLAGKLYDAAKRGGVGAAVGTVATPILGPGVGAAIASALTRGAKPAANKAVDALIASPEFVQAVRAAGGTGQAAAARSLAYSKPFTRFVRALGQPRELSNRERWVMQALQADNQTRR